MRKEIKKTKFTFCHLDTHRQTSFEDSHITLHNHISSHNKAVFKNKKFYNGIQQLFKQSIIFF